MTKLPYRFCEIIIDFRLRVENAIKELLENKHLYQNVTVSTDDLKTPLKQGSGRLLTWQSGNEKKPTESYEWIDSELLTLPTALTDALTSVNWKYGVETPETKAARSVYPSDLKNEPMCFLPRLSRSCAKCGEKTAQLPQYFGELSPQPLTNLDFGKDDSGKKLQVLVVAYQCQVCRSEPNVFVIRRQGLKLSLVGRSVFEKISLPKYIPEPARHHYSEALVASTAGKYLPACLYLRLVIEHHMRASVNPTKISQRPTGDELADEYSKVLHPEFPRSLHSLKSVYAKLSETIHEGREDFDTFVSALDSISKHFDQLRMLPLQNWSALEADSSATPVS